VHRFYVALEHNELIRSGGQHALWCRQHGHPTTGQDQRRGLEDLAIEASGRSAGQ
jgi:hypothetical protein